MKKLMKMVLSAGCLVLGAEATRAADEIKYLDWDPTTSNLVERTCSAYELVTSATREFADGKWYVVADTVVIDNGDNITVNGSAHLILCDNASLTVKNVASYNAAIDVSASGSATNSLTIYGQQGGSGLLSATGGLFGAGIGGGNGGAGGTVTINDGTVTATGGGGSAGIGGGYNGAGGVVTINGGTVTATGGGGSAGIGGGYNGAGGNVTINGGEVTAASGEQGAGIGGGNNGAGGAVTVNGGTLTATGGNQGAGIGGGSGYAGGSVTVNGGTVTATGGSQGAGIGGGWSGAGGAVTINGGTVTATGGGNFDGFYYGAGIGGGDGGDGGTVTINGGSVTVMGACDDFGNDYGTCIGGGHQGADGAVTLGENVMVVDGAIGNGSSYAKIVNTDDYQVVKVGAFERMTAMWTSGDGAVTNPVERTLFCVKSGATNVTVIFTAKQDYEILGDSIVRLEGTITENVVFGDGNDYAVPTVRCVFGDVAYLDWDDANGKMTNATLSATDYALVTAETRELANGMWYVVAENVAIPDRCNIKVNGSANLILCDNISLTIMRSSDNKAAIDVSASGSTTNALTIYGQQNGSGSLTANGSSLGSCSGIGGSDGGAGGTITINGGTVTATSHSGGAGIGGSRDGAGGSVTINGGTVTANGSFYGAGIGGGDGGDGGDVTINGGMVTATGGQYGGAGIGGGDGGDGGDVTINGGMVTATGGQYGGAGIGGGYNGADGSVDLGENVIVIEGAVGNSSSYVKILNTDEYKTVTVGAFEHMTAVWTSGDGTVTNPVGETFFWVKAGTTNVTVIFTAEQSYEISGDPIVRLEGTITENVVFGDGNDYAVPTAIRLFTVTVPEVENATVLVTTNDAPVEGFTGGELVVLSNTTVVVEYAAVEGWALQGETSFTATVEGDLRLPAEGEEPTPIRLFTVTVPEVEGAAVTVTTNDAPVEGFTGGELVVLSNTTVAVEYAAVEGWALQGETSFTATVEGDLRLPVEGEEPTPIRLFTVTVPEVENATVTVTTNDAPVEGFAGGELVVLSNTTVTVDYVKKDGWTLVGETHFTTTVEGDLRLPAEGEEPTPIRLFTVTVPEVEGAAVTVTTNDAPVEGFTGGELVVLSNTTVTVEYVKKDGWILVGETHFVATVEGDLNLPAEGEEPTTYQGFVVTIGAHENLSVAWAFGDGTKVTEVKGEFFVVLKDEQEDVKVIFTPDYCYRFVSDSETGVRVLASPLTADCEVLSPEVELIPGSEKDHWVAGDDVTAYTNGTGVLIIEGTGAMDDFASAAEVPWAEAADKVMAVTIAAGVTHVGKNALAGFVDTVTVNGTPLSFYDMMAGARGLSEPIPSGAISGTEFERIDIVDGKAYLDVSVYTSDTLTNQNWSVATNGVIEVPVPGKQGFFYLMSKPAVPSNKPFVPPPLPIEQ